MPLGERGPRRIRLWEEARPRLGRETTASGTRDGRVWDGVRRQVGMQDLRLVFSGEQVGESVCSFSRQRVGEKPEILNVGLFFVVSLSLHPVSPEKKYHYFRHTCFFI